MALNKSIKKPIGLDEGITFLWKPPTDVDSVNGEKEEKHSRVQVIGERLLEIEKKHGYLKADIVVEDARDPGSPLHRHFEWDDSIAGEKFRRAQARQLISTVYIKPPASAEAQMPIRAWVNVLKDKDGDRRYENVAVAMSDELKRTRLLTQAKRELALWQKRYEGLQELSRVFKAIEEIKSVA